MWTYRRKNLRDKNYKDSPTYKKYFKYVGKIVSSNTYIGVEHDSQGQMVKDKFGNAIPIYEDRLFLIIDVVPQKYYSNRFAFKLKAYGKHNDTEEGAAEMVKRLNGGFSWKVVG